MPQQNSVFTKTKRTTNTPMVVENVLIDEKEAIKYLDVHIDILSTFQEETKHTIKIDAGIKASYTIRITIPYNKKISFSTLCFSVTFIIQQLSFSQSTKILF